MFSGRFRTVVKLFAGVIIAMTNVNTFKDRAQSTVVAEFVQRKGYQIKLYDLLTLRRFLQKAFQISLCLVSSVVHKRKGIFWPRRLGFRIYFKYSDRLIKK